jgi:adenylate cyclase
MPGPWLRRAAAALAVGLAAGAFSATEYGGFVQRKGLDYLFWMRHVAAGPIYPAERSPVAVVVIDEESYDAEPLRDRPQVAWTPQIAQLLNALNEGGAKSVGLDIVYPTTLEAQIPNYDRPLRQAVGRLGRSGKLVLGAIDSSQQPIRPEKGIVFAAGGDDNVRLLNLISDYDNVIREHPGWRTATDGTRQPSFIGEIAQRAGVGVPEAFLINYDTGEDGFPIFSFADLLACASSGNDAFFREAFEDRVVLVGTALDIEDRWIPATQYVNGIYGGPTRRCTERPADARKYGDSVERHTRPGVFIHAAALNTLLLDVPLYVPGRLASGSGVAATVAAGAFGFLALPPILAFGTLLLALGATVAASLAALLNGIVLPMLTLLGAFILSAGIVYLLRFIEELRARRRTEAEKRRLSERFGRYLAPAIIARLTDDPDALRLGGDRRRVSVFFSDIVGYTTLSERLQDEPERLVELVNEYFGVMVSIIEQHGGYVDKFIGDAVMAVWGAPLARDDQERQAVSAALACVAALETFNAEKVVGQYGLPPIGARIGINTGPAIVGNMGSPERLNYTVTGDTVNLASRLEGANKSYGTLVMIGPETADAVRDEFLLRQLDLLAVKGKKIPVRVYEAIGRLEAVDDATRQRIAAYNAALDLYVARRFKEAETAFAALAEATGDEVAALYGKRCRAYIETPPPGDWDGSFGLTEK